MTTTNYRDVSGDPFAIPANRIPPAPAADPGRAEFTAALRQLADYLDTHPSLPVPYGDCAAVIPTPDGTTDAERRAEVDRIAAVLGVEPEDNADGSHHVAEVKFGGRVRYAVAAITDAHMRAWEAERSYAGSVRPEPAVTP